VSSRCEPASCLRLSAIDGKIKQLVCIRFCVKLVKPVPTPLKRFVKLSENTFNQDSGFSMAFKFQGRPVSVENDHVSGRPNTSKSTENAERALEPLHDACRRTMYELCKTWGFHGGDYEEWCLLGCYSVLLLEEPKFRRTLAPPSFLRSVHRLLVTASVVPSSLILVTLMNEVLISSETSVLTSSTRRNIPENTDLNGVYMLIHWRMVSSLMVRRAALVRTDVSVELRASFIRVTGIGELGTTLAVTCNRRSCS
jgi:hypothetical protein